MQVNGSDVCVKKRKVPDADRDADRNAPTAGPPFKRRRSITPIEDRTGSRNHVTPQPRGPSPGRQTSDTNANQKGVGNERNVITQKEKRSPWKSRPSWAFKTKIPPRTSAGSSSPSLKPSSNANASVAGRRLFQKEDVEKALSFPSPDSHTSGARSRPRSSSDHQGYDEEVARIKSIFSLSPKDSQLHDLQRSSSTPPQAAAKIVSETVPVGAILSSKGSIADPDAQSSVLPRTPSTTPRKPVFEGVVIPRYKPVQEDGVHAKSRRKQPSAAKARAEKEKLLRDLEKSSLPIRTRLGSVERVFGHNGFSETYSTEEDQKRLEMLAQRKVRKVKRKQVGLDFGEPFTPGEENPAPLIHPSEQARQILHAKFNGYFNPPLTITNEINDRQLNGKFQFTSDYILGQKVSRAAEGFNSGCNCIGGCDPSTCLCLEKDIMIGRDENDKPIYRRQQVQTYTRRHDGQVVLTDTYLEKFSTRSEITECNQVCGCDERCLNRVVQKGRTVPLDIFQTAKCGFGVRSSSDLVRGQFIDLYLGEILTQQALDIREAAKEEGSSSYIFTLDWWNELPDHYHIDGENFGSAMKFVNHSCEANSKSLTVQLGHHADKRVYYIAFFAIRNIKAGDEITIDYNPQLATDQNEQLRDLDEGIDPSAESGSPNDRDSDGLAEGTVLCQCGAPNCRIRLWPKARTQRKRRRRL